MPEETGSLVSVTEDDFTVSSNMETEDDLRENLKSKPKPLDGEEKTPEEEEAEEARAAAKKLGKKGGEAAAKAAKQKAKDEEDEEDEDSDDLDEEDKEKPKEEPKKSGDPRRNPRARVQEATRKEAEARRALEAERQEKEDLKRRLEDLERVRDQYIGRPETKKPERTGPRDPDMFDEPEPDESDFDTFAEGIKAKTDWAVRKAIHEDRVRQRQEQQAAAMGQQLSSKMDGYRQRASEALQAHPEYAEEIDPRLDELTPSSLLEDGKRPDSSNILADCILESRFPVEMQVYLSRNPDIVSDILDSANVPEVVYKFGRVEGMLMALAKASAKNGNGGGKSQVRTSRAAPPISPLGTTAQESDDPRDDDDLDAHIEKMERMERKRRRSA